MSKIDLLIEKIESLQFQEENKYFSKGMFASYRFHNWLPYFRKDDNIFFPALIAFTFLNHLEAFDTKQKEQVLRIVDGIRANYDVYLGKKEIYIYNFYETKPNRHYPFGKVLSKFRHFKLPEDADDTVIVAMTLEENTEEHIHVIREFLERFSNLKNKEVKGIDPAYSKLPVYGTWFGTGRMPIEIELCVLCNVLCFIFKNDLSLNDQDKASLEFIRKAVVNEDIVTKRYSLSSQYSLVGVILYHITRLQGFMKKEKAYFDQAVLIRVAKNQLLKTTSFLEKIMLSISLLKLGQEIVYLDWDLGDDQIKNALKLFPFFTGPMLSGTANPILNYLKQFDLFKIHFGCEAYYYTLLLEYEILVRNTHGKN